ncbi:MAG: OmpA/MotB domain protein, partial [Segetibacter sp.]|nr:OmpA/MotB domain protein [Segetibacter sp.]
MNLKLFLAVPVMFATLFAAAQEPDAEKCKDHPFFNRLPNFRIESCEENFNMHQFVTAANTKNSQEGNVTRIRYVFNSETAKPPSPLQITRNYESAILKNGGKKVYVGSEDGTYIALGTFTMAKDGKEYWVTVDNMAFPSSNSEVAEFDLFVLEKEPMKQDIQANAIFEELENKGSIALYINFETAKADIKTESQKIIDEIATMLKDNVALKVSIEGHTDNTGVPATNKVLSENRAKAVMNA